LRGVAFVEPCGFVLDVAKALPVPPPAASLPLSSFRIVETFFQWYNFGGFRAAKKG
jgi:hypothetical protein